MNNYFDIERDNLLPCFCQACLVGKPVDDMSPDPRYCQSCYDFLLKEAEIDSSRRQANWKPILPHKETEKEGKKAAQVYPDIRTIKSTLEDEKTTVDLIQRSVRKKLSARRGPKYRVLPESIIRQLNDDGMGAKAIATQLKHKHNTRISYKTIQRFLARGEGCQAIC